MKPTKQQEKEAIVEEKLVRRDLNELIGKHVLHILGQPADLHRIQVRPLWADRFRVNILVGVNAATTKVLHSFFLVADGEGNIVQSTPQITKQY